MLDKNNHLLEAGNKVWIIVMDKHLWEVMSIGEKVNIKNTVTDQELSIDSVKLLKHAE